MGRRKGNSFVVVGLMFVAVVVFHTYVLACVRVILLKMNYCGYFCFPCFTALGEHTCVKIHFICVICYYYNLSRK